MQFTTRRSLAFGLAMGAFAALSPTAGADEKGDSILRGAFTTLHAAKTMSADLVMRQEFGGQSFAYKGTVSLKKPNLMRFSVKANFNGRSISQHIVSDGKNLYQYAEGSPQYMRSEVEANPKQMQGMWEGEVDAFFGGEKNAASISADYAGTATVNGVNCDVVKAHEKTGQKRTITYTIGRADHLIYQMSFSQSANNQTLTQTNTLTNIKLNADMQPSLFAFTPPAGAKLYDPAEQMRAMEAKLVPAGEPAPPFELTDPKSKDRFSLAKALDGRKAVLVNFWFYG